MSADALPISPARFADALTSLPLANLHFKAAELRNSIAHLQASNVQLKPYADDGDRECAEALKENVDVIQRMEERIELVKQEVEGRGYKWDAAADVEKGRENHDGHVVNGHSQQAEGLDEEQRELNGSGRSHNEGTARQRLADDELARRLRERMGEDMDEEDGVHL